MRINNLLILFSLLVLAACSDKEDPLEDLFLDFETSSESVDYGDTFTLTWNSNASQCYAGGRWFGEKEITGSEELEIKRGGTSTFIMDCRRNNEFINQAVAVTIVKARAIIFYFHRQQILLILQSSTLKMRKLFIPVKLEAISMTIQSQM